MDPPEPESPASMALEPGGTPPTRRADDDDATWSSSTIPPSVEPTVSPDEEGLSGAAPGGQRRASLADDTTPRFSAANFSMDAAHIQAVPTTIIPTSDIPSTVVPAGQRQVLLADDANKLSTTLDHAVSVELAHNQAVPSNSNVPSEAASNVSGSLANASITDAPVELARNQAAPFEPTAGPARRGSNVHSGRSVPRRASVQVADDVSASSSLSDSLVAPPHIQAVPSIESSIGLRSTAGVVQQRHASAATDASPVSSRLDSLADTLHNQAVPSGTWPTDDPSPSIDSAAAHHVLVTDNAAPFTGRSGHVVQIEQLDEASYEHVEGSGSPSSVSRRASREARVHIEQPMYTVAEAATSLDSLYTDRRPLSPGDHLSKIYHNASHSSISHEPAVPEHRSVVAATSPSDASLRHDVGVAASRLTEAAALLTEAAALLSKASGTSSWSPHEQPHETEAPNAFASAPSPDVWGAAHTGDHPDTDKAALNGAGQGPLDVQDPLQTQGTPEVKPDQALVAALTAAVGQPTGWAAIEKAMTDYDREEIGGYKEDIDSLLTFTGLYSAVLTAFVIVSYPLLQEDTPSESLQTLHVIANWTSTFMPATQASPSPSSSPFQPSSAAIRINVLWFASLVISLATASFAILVKQWLRSYLKFATASPQGQLRVRRFRRAGLDAWKVFAIASTLPLMLQVSLALFFAGLCIFTLNVHPTIGHTTLPLVCAWLFLFTVVTVSPSFTARCPYTTPALQGYTYTLRCHIYPVFVTVFMKYICFGVFMGVVYMLIPVLLALSWLEEKCATSKIMEHVGDSIMTVWEYLKGYEVSKPAEEAGMINDTQYDLKILASADALQADDRLVGTTIKSALEQSDANWVQLIEFAMQIIGNRIPVVNSETSWEHISNAYKSLLPSVRSVIEDIFQSYVVPKATVATHNSVDPPKDWKCNGSWTLCIIIHANTSKTILDIGSKQTHEAVATRSTWKTDDLQFALKLCHWANIRPGYIEDVKGSVDIEKWLVKQCLTVQYAAVCQILGAIYTNYHDIYHLSKIILDIVNYHSSDFRNLKAVEILKLSLLSVKVMSGKLQDNLDSTPRWSSVEAAQWKRTFIWLADRLDDFHPFNALPPDELAALRQLARSSWVEIPDPTEDSSQQALPLPDYFYLMLWYAGGEDPSQHPQRLRIAHMSSDEQIEIRRKGLTMAWVYRHNPGNLYPPGTEDDNGDGVQDIRTSVPPQDTQDPTTNNPGVGADELGLSEGLQQELPTDISEVPSSESRAPLEAGLRATETAEQCSWTNAEPAGGFRPGQTSRASHQTIHSTEDTELSPGERRDSSHDGDGPKKLPPSGNPAELAEGPENLAAIAAHQGSVEGGATPSISESRTMPAALPTSARDKIQVPAEARDDLEVTADGTRADTTLNHTTSSLCDDAVGEDNSRHADDIVAGNSHTIQGSSGQSNEDHTRTDVEVDCESEKQTVVAEARVVK